MTPLPSTPDAAAIRAAFLADEAATLRTLAAKAATDDAARAARRLMTDDGFNIGVLYAGNRTPFPLGSRRAPVAPADLEAEFAP